MIKETLSLGPLYQKYHDMLSECAPRASLGSASAIRRELNTKDVRDSLLSVSSFEPIIGRKELPLVTSPNYSPNARELEGVKHASDFGVY